MDYEEIYRATIEKWGVEAQYDQAVEECAELITAIKHYRRGKIGKTELLSELADVSLMLGQLTYMLGESELEAVLSKKVSKLNKLLSET